MLIMTADSNERLATQIASGAILFLFFLIQGIRASLCTPQLIPESTEHPASPVNI